MAYQVDIETAAAKQIQRLQRDLQIRVMDAIDGLAIDPRPNGCVKLSARDGYRIRVGMIRIVYLVEDGIRVVTVTRVAHRREVYR